MTEYIFKKCTLHVLISRTVRLTWLQGDIDEVELQYPTKIFVVLPLCLPYMFYCYLFELSTKGQYVFGDGHIAKLTWIYNIQINC